MCEGIATELEGIDLGDKRLNDRSARVIELLAANPEASINAASINAASINAACGGWDDTMAAYRLFDNPAVAPEKILQPHIAKTHERIRQHPVALMIQDTTELDFTPHPPKDARCLNTPERFGFYDHTYLAVTPDRLCLGVLGGELFDRDPESLGKASERRTLSIEQKESLRWLTGFREAARLAEACPNTQIVSVADSEADIYDIFLEAEQQAGPVKFIVRAKEERSTPQRDLAAGPHAYRKVRDEVRASEVRILRTLDLPQTPKRAARRAELEIRAQRVTVKPPHARSTLPPVTLGVVLAEEVNGPQDGTDVNWMLLTNLPVETVKEILQVLDYYTSRWPIEVYFRVLKTGCRVEEMQLETRDRIKNCLAFYKIVAWRVMYLTNLNRECPELPCTAVFEDCEWKSVWRVTTKKELPKKPPTLGEFMKLLAELGGYNNRAKEPPPGPQVIWVGIRRMADFAIAWLAFGPHQEALVYK